MANLDALLLLGVGVETRSLNPQVPHSDQGRRPPVRLLLANLMVMI